jgi:Leucine-rich repeat (LRR) protein
LEYISLIGFAPHKDQVDNFFVQIPNLKRLILGNPSVTLLNHALQNRTLKQFELYGILYIRQDTTLQEDSLNEKELFFHPTIEKMIIHSGAGGGFRFLTKINGENNVLKELIFQHNHVVEVDSSISKLKALKILRMTNSGVTVLPKEVTQLRALEVLDLSNNEPFGMDRNSIYYLPQEITNLRGTLKELILTGNPIPTEQRATIQSWLPNTTIIW